MAALSSAAAFSAWLRPSSFLSLNSGSIKVGDSAIGLNSALKAAINGDFGFEDKPMWFILHSDDGIFGRFLT
ncbi:hypothetical protein [Halomonas sp. NCCP-2165]|nr:hypothetical protein [Halomonas sp. NCCP-2165]